MHTGCYGMVEVSMHTYVRLNFVITKLLFIEYRGCDLSLKERRKLESETCAEIGQNLHMWKQ